MSDTEINVETGKFIPKHIYDDMPGIDGQKRRAWLLRRLNLVPISFTNVLLKWGQDFAITTVVIFLIDLFFRGLILQHLPGVIILVLMVMAGKSVHSWTILKNAPELKEELRLNDIMSVSVFVASLWVVLR